MISQKTQILLLYNYQKTGIQVRCDSIELFLRHIQELLPARAIDPPIESNIELDKRIANLQIAALSHIMMLIEDLGALSYSFLKKNIDFYSYLDGSGDDELGKIIGDFYDSVLKLKNDDILKILGYVNPNQHRFPTTDDKNMVISLINDNIVLTKRVLANAKIFRESHIKIFRRYKHAGYPILLAPGFSKTDEDLKEKYDFISYALTSKSDLDKELAAAPFSAKVIESYRNLLADLSSLLYSITESHIRIKHKKIDGVIPFVSDCFSKRYSSEIQSRLKLLWDDIENNSLIKEDIVDVHLDAEASYGVWNHNIDFYSKKIL